MPPSKVPVTVAMLMHHSAGIRDSLELLRLAGFPRASATDKDTTLRLLLAQRDTNFTPGKIGREAGRERVGPYVTILVAAGYINKATITSTKATLPDYTAGRQPQ